MTEELGQVEMEWELSAPDGSLHSFCFRGSLYDFFIYRNTLADSIDAEMIGMAEQYLVRAAEASEELSAEAQDSPED